MNRFSVSLKEVGKHRLVLYGFSALWVLLIHSGFVVPARGIFLPLYWLQANGGCGVTIFALLSGFGLYHSFKRKPQIGPFYARRALRVLPAGLIVTIIGYGLRGGGAGRYLAALTFFPYWLGYEALWYIPFIMTMYFLYPLLFKLQQKSPKYLLIPLALSFALMFASPIVAPKWHYACRLGVVHIPAFLIGCMIAPWFEEDRALPWWLMPVSLAVYVAITLKIGLPTMQNSNGVFVSYLGLATFVIMLLTHLAGWFTRGGLRRCIYRLFAFYGSISLEVYLVYSRLYEFMERMDVARSGEISADKFEIAAILLTTLCAVLVQRFGNLLADLFRKLPVPNPNE